MKQITVVKFLEENKDDLFPNSKYSEIEVEELLLAAPEHFEYVIEGMDFKSSSTASILAVLLGLLGADRFYLGDYVKGLLKYVTLGLGGVWWIIDMISVKKRCRTYNCKKLIEALDNPAVVSQMRDEKAKFSQAGKIAKSVFAVSKDAAKEMRNIKNPFDLN